MDTRRRRIQDCVHQQALYSAAVVFDQPGYSIAATTKARAGRTGRCDRSCETLGLTDGHMRTHAGGLRATVVDAQPTLRVPAGR